METSLHPTSQHRVMLNILRQNQGKAMSYKELTNLGFDLSDVNLRPIKHLIKIDDYNKENYTYEITSNGIGYLEEYERTEQEYQIDLQYRSQTIFIANEANRLSEKANQQSKISNQIAKNATGEAKKANTIAEESNSIAKEANKNSTKSNKLSLAALIASSFSAFGTIAAFVVAVVALCLKVGG